MDEAHADWLANCNASASAIAALILEHPDAPDHADAVAPLLRNRVVSGIPPRSGYWVGDLIARGMLKEGYDLKNLLSVGTREARHRVLARASRHRAKQAQRRRRPRPEGLHKRRNGSGSQPSVLPMRAEGRCMWHLGRSSTSPLVCKPADMCQRLGIPGSNWTWRKRATSN